MQPLKSLKNTPFHYCAGCGHGIIHRLIAETIDELDIRERTIGVAPVGCAVLLYDYLDIDFIEAAHGRASAVATAIKRVQKDCIVFSYQGDGDLAAIGTAEIIHAACRGELITVFFVNNAIYGMTGGQMAPTTLIDQVTSTTPRGRKVQEHGWPLKVCELLSSIEGVSYLARVAVNAPANVIKAKAAVKEAFSTQLQGRGFALVEVLSMCPVGWHMKPLEATKWISQNLAAHFPLGVFKS